MAAPPAQAADSSPGEPADLGVLRAIGAASGPDVTEALAALGRLRASPFEGRALDELSRIAARGELPDPLVVAMAGALVDRGEPAAAKASLSGLASSSALLLRADLEAQLGDMALALTLVERVLARDLDFPGARERRLRFRGALGLESRPARSAPTATVALAEPEGPYALIREVARGGAGAVYEALDRDLGRRVALKIYHEPIRDRAQLEHEARVAVRLSGPAIVRVLDVDPEHGWLALEWAPAGALRERIRARDGGMLMPMGRWAAPLAAALARVHEAGFVHLDVKPANVLLEGAAMPVLADFGSARRIGEASPPGSAGYVSPERAAGAPADPRDDVYGFGRIVEEVVAAASGEARGWSELARLCTGPAPSRPATGRALAACVARLKL